MELSDNTKREKPLNSVTYSSAPRIPRQRRRKHEQRANRERSPFRGNLQNRPSAAREIRENRCHVHGETLEWAATHQAPRLFKKS